MAVYVFVGVAFIIGLLCASVYARLRARHRVDPQQISAAALARLAAMIRKLDETRRPAEVGAVMLDEICTQLGCRKAAFYSRHDVELRLEASRGLSNAGADSLGRQLEADADVLAAPHGRHRLRLHSAGEGAPVVPADDAGEYALVSVSDGPHRGVTAIAPPTAAESGYARSLIEAVSGHALARLEAIRLGDELRQAATQDAVTRLHNHRYFLELLELEFNRSLRYQRSLALLMCGIDGLALLNSREGSEAGDRVLRQIANTCRGSLRYFDVIGRYDVDTLAVMLPEAHAEVATAVADRLLGAAAEIEAPLNSDAGLSLSIGVACVNDPDADFLTLVGSARDALHRARSDGGNCVRTSPG